VKILDDNDKEVGPGETGHLIIRGTSITPGYWMKPEENERNFSLMAV